MSDLHRAADELNHILDAVFAQCEQRAVPNPAIATLRKQAMAAALRLNAAVARMEAKS